MPAVGTDYSGEHLSSSAFDAATCSHAVWLMPCRLAAASTRAYRSLSKPIVTTTVFRLRRRCLADDAFAKIICVAPDGGCIGDVYTGPQWRRRRLSTENCSLGRLNGRAGRGKMGPRVVRLRASSRGRVSVGRIAAESLKVRPGVARAIVSACDLSRPVQARQSWRKATGIPGTSRLAARGGAEAL